MLVDGCPVHKMKTSSHGATCEGIMKKISINTMCQLNRFTKWFRCVMRKEFLHITTDIVSILRNRIQITAIRLMSLEVDLEVLHLE